MVESGGTSGDIRRIFDEYQKRYPAQARVEYYREAAVMRLQAAQDDKATTTLRWIIKHADEALQALAGVDVDAFAQAFERVLRYTVDANIPSLESAARRRMGSKGGKASKRSPGPLRRVLDDIIVEIGKDDNRSVFDYWQTYENRDKAEDDSPDGSAWFRHQLWAEPTADYSFPKQYDHDHLVMPPMRHFFDKEKPGDARPADSEHIYHFVVDDTINSTNAKTIRNALHRIRKSR